MGKNKTIQNLNKKIDELIIKGQTQSKQYKYLTRLHKILVIGEVEINNIVCYK
jgi:hypothetical protein